MSECLEEMCLVKNGSHMYVGEDGAKELVIISSYKNKWTASCLVKGPGCGETHV